MKEFESILSAWHASRIIGEPCVLVTIVKTEGSTYRKAGTRMLITTNRKTHGTISGGCLEQTVVREALDKAMESGIATMTLTNSADDDDMSWSSGCHGKVHLLLERIDASQFVAETWANPTLELIERTCYMRKPGFVAIVSASKLAGVVPGDVITFFEGVEMKFGAWPHELGDQVKKDARDALATGKSRAQNKSYKTAAGEVEVLMDPIMPPTRLLLCGSGDDARSLARIAEELGWTTIVFDTRSKNATEDRFPGMRIIIGPADKVRTYVDAWTAGVIMTHRYADDVQLLRLLMPQRVGYLGILGPRGRTERILSEIGTATAVDVGGLGRLKSPIGLDLGAQTPEQISLAIAAEILATMSGRTSTGLTGKVGEFRIGDEGATCKR